MQRNIEKTIQRTYQAWLTHREYSPATIQKYTKALARFFSDTGAGKIPDRETVAAWRDDLAGQGYCKLASWSLHHHRKDGSYAEDWRLSLVFCTVR